MHCYCTADACNNPSKKLSDPVAMRATGDFRGSQYLDLEEDPDDYSAGYGDDEDDEGGSGDYADYSDTTDDPPPSLSVDEEESVPKLTETHRDSVNDLDFDEEGGDKQVVEDEREAPSVVTADAGRTSLPAAVLILAVFLARLL